MTIVLRFARLRAKRWRCQLLGLACARQSGIVLPSFCELRLELRQITVLASAPPLPGPLLRGLPACAWAGRDLSFIIIIIIN